MRYLIALAGGVMAAVLLLVFQNGLIGGERDVRISPPVTLQLPAPRKLKPPETKEYREPREAPEPPPRTKKPVAPRDPDPPRVEPPRIPLAGLADFGIGTGPAIGIGHDGGFAAPDGGLGASVMIEPQYPADALRRGIEGEVEVEFTVQADGTVANVTVVAANPRGVFEQAAVRAVKGWQFLPRRINGEPVSTRVRQVLEFSLPDNQ